MTSSRMTVFNTLVLFSVRHIECFCTHRLSVTVAACLTFKHTHLSRTTAVSNWSLYQLALLQHTPFCGRPWLQRYDWYTGFVIFVPMNCLYIWNTNSHHTVLIGLKKCCRFGSNYVRVHLLWGYNIPNLALECITDKSFCWEEGWQ